jgi:hypothetical protein
MSALMAVFPIRFFTLGAANVTGRRDERSGTFHCGMR